MDPSLRSRFESKYDIWKEKLLDLSGSNRLLNFKTTKISTVKITRPSASGLFEQLVLSEQSLKFPFYRGRASVPKDIWSLSGDSRDANTRDEDWLITPGDLDTTKTPPELDKSLGKLAKLARSSREERGVNTLYLALGMLEWHPIQNAEPQLAPLLLIPVDLKRENRLEPYVLSPFDEDAEINPSLLYMLRKDFEYAAPEFSTDPDEHTLEMYLDQLSEAVKTRGWQVKPEAWLGQFQFKKLAMYKDLEEHSSQAASHEVLTSVAGCKEFPESAGIPPEHEFDKIDPREVFTIRDADSSQLKVILRARAGENLIVQGPPGTGKSQTIANLIAQFLHDGRKVLFVSEKMAALTVVFKRLEDAGLAPFCLEIHSDKANKRDVLAQIKRAKPSIRPNVSIQDIEQFGTLLRQREELNAYVRTLHQPVLHGSSAYQLHGRMSLLANEPDVSSRIDIPASALTPECENELATLVRKLAQIPGVIHGNSEHPWNGCNVPLWSMQLGDTVRSGFTDFHRAVVAVQPLAERVAYLMEVPAPSSYESFVDVLQIARMFSESPCPPTVWIHNSKLSTLEDDAKSLGVKSARHRRLTEMLRAYYTPTLFQGDCNELARRLNPAEPSIVSASLHEQPRDSLAEHCSQLEARMSACLRAVDGAFRHAETLAPLLDEPAPVSLADVRRLSEIASVAASDPRPTAEWFEWLTLDSAIDMVQEARSNSQLQGEHRSHLSAEFTEDLYNLPLSGWHHDFAGRFSSPFKVFIADYHRCRKGLAHVRTSRRRPSYTEAAEAVGRGAEVLRIESWFAENRQLHGKVLGLHYSGSRTDWDTVASHLSTFRRLLELKRHCSLSSSLAGALLGGGSLGTIGALGKLVDDQVRAFDEHYSAIAEHLRLDVFTGMEIGACPLENLGRGIRSACDQIVSYRQAITILQGALRSGCARDAESMLHDAAAAGEVQKIEEQYSASSAALEHSYGHLFDGVQTDWARVIEGLRWTRSFLDQIGPRQWSSACALAACSPERREQVIKELSALESRENELGAGLQSHAAIFGADYCLANGTSLRRSAFGDLAEWLRDRIDRIGMLHEWIRFTEIRKECADKGLERFLSQAIEMDLPAECLEKALRKRLLTIQLDAVYEKAPVLRRFLWQDHQHLVEQFQQLDRRLMKTYANRVRKAIMERQPNLDGPAAGQAAFLRRELAKQKRHAPLRKLFHESGTVILELTPCLLMSPLSVATFLPKDTVQFDVVIFDEASQVPSEEATGAILRGRQLIVAGDAKQLPPTRFFERSLDDGDDSDEQEQAPLDSLLEDCDASGMQSCKLLWHYRSKHEGLIAFSNAEFYNNDLVTFPAPKAKTHPGVGVRLVHVEDGVYDRGRSRTNRREAKRVAQLIEQHCREWGLKRSIGVIALSTAQEAAISEEIENLLERRPDLEPLLRPDSGEAFFVKPLENVQGDERDTIIISIGYGKSQDGQLSLNFGPINSPGGEKRLNVAVTRARWELVLVSSILASDIDESRLQSTGPKVLRRYLAFAKDGRLPAETVAPSGESESPFEAAVWEALNERGITADRQVGMSGYRIDLAIKDPDNLGEYLLGVECDGAAYHSSAVARDRDRLRQQILEDLGWRVHRIWSTDWIRDPKGCMLRLLQRLDEVKSSREGPTVAPDVPDAPSRGAAQESERQSDEPATPPDMRPEQDFEEGSYEGQPGIGVYDETPVAYRSREQFDLDHLIQTDLVDVVRREGPIHEELLARRVARIYQLKRTGHLVEGRIRRIISASCMRGEIRRKGSFVWMKDAVTVVPRRPAPGAELRQIEHVSPEELEAAALLVVRRSVGIAKDHLIQEAPRVLGYLRSGEKIRPAVLDAVNRLLEAGTLVVRGEHLFDGG